MRTEDAIRVGCPRCQSFDHIVRAADVRRDASELGDGGFDVALPAYEGWSMLLVVAILLLFGSAMAQSAEPPDSDGTPLGWVLMVAALVPGGIGIVRTRRNSARMKAAEPIVRWYHERALYCEACAHVHFHDRGLPPGIEAQVAWTVHDYRRELWYACGFAKSTFPFTPD